MIDADNKLIIAIGAVLLLLVMQAEQLRAVTATLHTLAHSVWGPDYAADLQRFIDEDPDYRPLTP